MNDSKPLVSVIMLSFNTEKYISQAIKSILNQNYKHFELIIIDNLSNDNTIKIIEEFQKKDNRIRTFFNKQNEGIAYSRKKALKLAKGKYIAVLDSDDVARNDRLSKQVSFLEQNPDYGLVGSNLIIINEKSKLIGKRIYPHNDIEIKKKILIYNPIALSAAVFRKELIKKVGGYKKHLNYCEDYDLFLRIGLISKIYNINDSLTYYRISKSQTKTKNLKETIINTLEIQTMACKKYGYQKCLVNYWLYYLYKLLLILPNNIVLFVFKLIRY